MSDTKTIAFYVGYRSLYGGNLIPSLRALDDAVRLEFGNPVIWLITNEAAEREWCKELVAEDRRVEFFDAGESISGQARWIRNKIKSYSIDWLHTQFASIWPPVLGALGTKAKVLRHNHSDFSLGVKQGAAGRGKQMIKTVLLRIGGVRNVYVSKPLADKQGNGHGYIPNAIASDRLHHAGEAEREVVRKEIGVAADELALLLFGWSPEVKGVDIAVNAVGELVEKGRRIRLLIVCSEAEGGGVTRSFVAQRCAWGEFPEFVTYLPPTQDVASYHRAADIMLSSSRSEGFPYSLLEALTIGNPCVMSDIEGTQWAGAYPSVIAFASEDAHECAEAIEEAARLLAAESAPRMLEEVSKQVQEDYSLDVWCNRIIDVYRNGVASLG